MQTHIKANVKIFAIVFSHLGQKTLVWRPPNGGTHKKLHSSMINQGRLVTANKCMFSHNTKHPSLHHIMHQHHYSDV